MGRPPCDESGLKKGPWTSEEDDKLVKHIQKHGHSSWRALPRLAGLNRCGKSCRLRWTNYLRPDIKRGKFSHEEEQTILHLHSILGNKWSAIATHLSGRTDNEIKNFWNTHLKKKLIQMGIDPMTHRPCTDIFACLPQLMALANLKELVDHHSSISWPSSLEQQLSVIAKLQTEQAVHQFAKLQYMNNLLQSTPPLSLQTGHTNHPPNMENLNYLSLYGSSSSTGIPNFDDDMTLPFSHMPNLQLPENIVHTSSDDARAANPSSSSAAVFVPVAPPVTSMTNSTSDDACSIPTTSRCGKAPPQFWPDLLLEDPLFHDIL
ncbi:hypothetical protein L2E82_44765 [Cichorium intybus]|uniref:Uncharacterized protein n=1 Tax=Cichorium intybus TaxID=13427 RepID=A0ACB8ZQ58_CICIN|nr:hypothetical protein L2E82_44765 [Cichorium intybus]